MLASSAVKGLTLAAGFEIGPRAGPTAGCAVTGSSSSDELSLP